MILLNLLNKIIFLIKSNYISDRYILIIFYLTGSIEDVSLSIQRQDAKSPRPQGLRKCLLQE